MADRDPLPKDQSRTSLPRFIEMAKSDESGLVRLVLASTLQRLPPADRRRSPLPLSHAEDANDHNLPKLIWYGLAPLVDIDPAIARSARRQWQMPLTREWIARAMAEEPAKNRECTRPAARRQTLDKDESVRADIVRGLTAGLAGRHKAEPPPNWEKFQASFVSAAPEVQEQVRSLAVVFGDGRALDEVRRVALDSRPKCRSARRPGNTDRSPPGRSAADLRAAAARAVSQHDGHEGPDAVRRSGARRATRAEATTPSIRSSGPPSSKRSSPGPHSPPLCSTRSKPGEFRRRTQRPASPPNPQFRR